MALIKNLDRLTGIPSKDINKMEEAARMHKQFSNIQFKIVDDSANEVIIQIAQGKTGTGIYHKPKRLVEIAHETFDRFITHRKLHIHPIQFLEGPASKVTKKWINEQMLIFSITLKEISTETGIDINDIRGIITGNIRLSKTDKALFYFYFLTKKK